MKKSILTIFLLLLLIGVGVRVAQAASVIRINGDNLQVCPGTGSPLNCALTPPACDGTNCGNVIVENKLGIGIGTPGSLLDVQGDAEFGAVNLLIRGADTSNPYIDLAVGDTGSGVGYGRGIILRRGRTGTGASNWANIGLINDTTLGIGAGQAVGSGVNIMTINSSGNVGIGNQSPTSLLQVGAGTYPVGVLSGINVATGGDSYLNVSDNTRQVLLGANSSGGVIGTQSLHAFVIRTNNTEQVRFTSGGNVGIGVTDPTATLEVNGNVKALGSSQFAQANNTVINYTAAPIQLREALYGGGVNLLPRISFHWGGVVASQIGIESSARLAILNNPGTGYENIISNISYASGSFRVANDSSTIMDANQFYCNAGSGINCFFNTGGTGVTYISNANNTVIGTGGGKLGVGTTPTYNLHVVGNANITGGLDMSQNTRLQLGQAYLSSGGNYAHLATNEYYNGTSWITNGSAGVLFQLDGAASARVYSHDTVGGHIQWAIVSGTGGWTAGSSRQFKQNIQELTDIDYQKLREQFLDTPLFSYNRKDKPSEPEVGFIAEEAPEYILDGSDKTQVTLIKGVGYLATLAKGKEIEIRDQKEKIASLEKVLETMQNDINNLKESSTK